jgi:predicted MFS family arabinose efflux permease
LLVDTFRWEAQTAGLAIGMAGVAGMTGAMVSSRLVKVVGVRTLVVTGSMTLAIGWYLYSRLTLGAGPMQVVVPATLVMFGLMMVLPVVAAQAFQTTPPKQRDEGAGLFNFTRLC